jgi:hypothetical protein
MNLKAIKVKFGLCLTLFLLSACDKFIRVSGVVLDYDSRKPLVDVEIYRNNNENFETKTDSAGKFEISFITGGLSRFTPPVDVFFVKNGFYCAETKIPYYIHDTIFMVKSDSSNRRTTLDKLKGIWINTRDSLSSLFISNEKLIFAYSRQEYLTDEYSYYVTDKLPEFVHGDELRDFLVLSRDKNDTLKYEITGITDSTFSLMHFPSVKMQSYRRKN